MESFFALLQKNVLDRHTWPTRADLHDEIVYWNTPTTADAASATAQVTSCRRGSVAPVEV